MTPTHARRGSVYVIVLVTIAAAVAISLAGLSIRQANAAESTITNDLVAARELAISASELADHRLARGIDAPAAGQLFDHWPTTGEQITASIDAITYGTACGTRRSPAGYVLTAAGTHGDATARLEATYTGTPALSPFAQHVLAIGHIYGYWPIDETGDEGDTAVCELVSGNDGFYSDTANPGRLEREFGGPAQIVSNEWRGASLPAPTKTMSKATIVAWVRFDNIAEDKTRGVLYSRKSGLGTLPNLDITVNTATGLVNITIGTTDENTTYQTFSNFQQDTWHMIAVTTKKNKHIDYFFDNTQHDHGTDIDHDWDPSDTNDIIMGVQTSSLGFPFNELDGAIRDIVIFEDELSASEIEELYDTWQLGESSSTPDTVVHRWATD